MRVDGEIVCDPARDVDDHNRVTVDGRALTGAEARVSYALHKPLGVVSTASDPHGRRTVVDLVPIEIPPARACIPSAAWTPTRAG